MKHLEVHGKQVLENPLLIGLLSRSSAWPITSLDLSLEEIDACLNPDSELSLAFSMILMAEKNALTRLRRDNSSQDVLLRASHETEFLLEEILKLHRQGEKNLLSSLVHLLDKGREEGFSLRPDFKHFLDLQDNPEKAKKFAQAICLINASCEDLRMKLQEHDPAKLQDFEKFEVQYKEHLYALTFKAISKNLSKEDFNAELKVQTKEMMELVDAEKHPWVMGFVRGFTNALGLLILGIPNAIHYKLTHEFFFFTHKEEGKKNQELLQEGLENILSHSSSPAA